jgi:hypothetical protein
VAPTTAIFIFLFNYFNYIYLQNMLPANMRTILIFLTLLVANVAIAQVKDDFSDGNFSANPIWSGNTDRFAINANNQLQSAGANLANQNIYLSTSSTSVSNTVWEFFFQLNFDPTTTNAARVYLVSNQANLSGALQGYFIQIGETGSLDGFHLYRQNGTGATQIIAGLPKVRQSSGVVTARIKVTRNNTGKWQLYSDVYGGTNYIFEGEVTDNTYTSSSYLGVNCRYATASRFDQFFFDDFDVKALSVDVTAPTLVSTSVVDGKTLSLIFNEPLNADAAQNVANYQVNGVSPVSITIGALSNSVILVFASEFTSGTSNLIASNIADVVGNVAPIITKPFTYIRPYVAQKGDVIINEIFADPSPVVGLPDKEFVELYNASNEYIIITGWRLKDGVASGMGGTIAADTLAPKEYRILCAIADVVLYKPFGKTIGLSSWPSLNNDTDDLKLLLPDATTIIDQVAYVDTWYRDETKKQGGYSLELISSNSFCTGAANWSASLSPIGGTPGAQNSIYLAQLDQIAPKLLSSTTISETEIRLFFDKSIDANTLSVLTNYVGNNGLGNPINALVAFDNKSVTLTFGQAISRGITNKITVQNITSCAGVLIDADANSIDVFIAKEVKPGDVLISEILFNPKAEGTDFIEVYNNADYVIDLKDLTISNPSLNGSASSQRVISTISVFVQPKQYWVLTADVSKVTGIYQVSNPAQFVQVPAMPSFNNGSGVVKIWKGTEVIDEISYDEKMHHALLKEVKGVCLERISFKKSGNSPGNMQSAAGSVGYATPTSQNSQAEDPTMKNNFKVSNKTFSPDNDGFEDLLNISYQFKESGNLATINVYTDKGVLVRKLAKNISFATQGSITWDGLNDAGQLSKVGIYLITADIFSPTGNKQHFKQTCVLATKLN